jgi:hypothetical protein
MKGWLAAEEFIEGMGSQETDNISKTILQDE